MRPRWNSTVPTLAYGSAAVCPAERPAATSRGTACSAGVSLSRRARYPAHRPQAPVARLQIRPGAPRDPAQPGRTQARDALGERRRSPAGPVPAAPAGPRRRVSVVLIIPGPMPSSCGLNVPPLVQQGRPLATPGYPRPEHSSRRDDDLGAVLTEELHRIVAPEEPAGELRPPQTRAHLDLQPHWCVGRIPGKVTTARRNDNDLTGRGHDLDAIDAKRGPASSTSKRSSIFGWTCSVAR